MCPPRQHHQQSLYRLLYEEQETILDAEILDLFAFWIVTIHRDTQQQSSNLHLLQPC